jgi:16S rRNA processing protein RimM
MLNIQDYLFIGVFTRTHGVKGALILRLQGVEAEDLPEMEWVFVEIDGLPVPFLANNVRLMQADKIILSLDTVSTEPRARELVGCSLFIPSKSLAGKAIKGTGLPDIKGYMVIDRIHGEMGRVVEVVAITGNPLLKILSGKKELLIPAHGDIILEINDKERSVLIKAPEGLMEL